MRILCLTCLLALIAVPALAGTITTNHSTRVLVVDTLTTQPGLATATMRVGDVTWNIGTFSMADVDTQVVATKDTATFDWQKLEEYLCSTSMVYETIDAGSLYAHTQWQFPPTANAYIYAGRVGLLELRFKLENFVVDGTSGFLAGTYKMTFETIPEPTVALLLAILVLGLFLLRRRSIW
jgi:hypothetical protein